MNTVLGRILLILLAGVWMPHSRAASELDGRPFGVDTFDISDSGKSLVVRNKIPDLASIPVADIRTVETESSADSALFDAKRFPRLNLVILHSENNERHLLALARNYAELTDLTITGRHGLSSVQALARLRKLKLLQIEGAVVHADEFWGSIPNSLATMVVIKSGLLSKPVKQHIDLPELDELITHNESVLSTDFGWLNAPALASVSFNETSLGTGTISSLQRFKKLTTLRLYKTPVNEAELKALTKALPTLHVEVTN